MPSRLDLAVAAAVLTGGLLFIEAGHRTELALPQAPVLAAATDPCAGVDIRYAANRLMFLEGGYVSGIRGRQAGVDRFALPPGCVP